MMNLSHYMNLRLLKQLLQAQNSASNKSVTHEDCLPHTFFHSDQNSDSVEKMSSVKTISTHTELSSAVTPENILISPSGKSLPSWENIRYFHSSKESDDLHSRHSPLYICRKEVPLDPCLILRSLEATPNQIATSSNGNITVGTETLSPRKICINVRDSELDKTPTFPDCRSVQEPPMTTSRKLAIIVYSSQALSCKTNTDACYPKEMGASSGIILSDCKQISEMTSMNHIKTEDYHSITVNTACIKTDFQKQLSASLKNPEHENLQFHPSKDYASELREDMPAGRYFEALEGPELEVLKVVRLNFFRGLRFSIAWWAYTFPMAAASIATIHYSQKVPCLFTQGLATALSLLSAAMVFALFLSTCHTCVLGDFFPNDVAIAITKKRRK
ncbi:hypothetical protein O6H91_Y110100 [Diphasiastrum complanatum]|nr:hypothetical protein O6H91_Y110100 [Diphasiastrum complanatum]